MIMEEIGWFFAKIKCRLGGAKMNLINTFEKK